MTSQTSLFSSVPTTSHSTISMSSSLSTSISNTKPKSNSTSSTRVLQGRCVNRNGVAELKSFLKGKYLGKGGFAKVYLLTNVRSGEECAGKIVPKSRLTKQSARAKVNASFVSKFYYNNKFYMFLTSVGI